MEKKFSIIKERIETKLVLRKRKIKENYNESKNNTTIEKNNNASDYVTNHDSSYKDVNNYNGITQTDSVNLLLNVIKILNNSVINNKLNEKDCDADQIIKEIQNLVIDIKESLKNSNTYVIYVENNRESIKNLLSEITLTISNSIKRLYNLEFINSDNKYFDKEIGCVIFNMFDILNEIIRDIKFLYEDNNQTDCFIQNLISFYYDNINIINNYFSYSTNNFGFNMNYQVKEIETGLIEINYLLLDSLLSFLNENLSKNTLIDKYSDYILMLLIQPIKKYEDIRNNDINLSRNTSTTSIHMNTNNSRFLINDINLLDNKKNKINNYTDSIEFYFSYTIKLLLHNNRNNVIINNNIYKVIENTLSIILLLYKKELILNKINKISQTNILPNNIIIPNSLNYINNDTTSFFIITLINTSLMILEESTDICCSNGIDFIANSKLNIILSIINIYVYFKDDDNDISMNILALLIHNSAFLDNLIVFFYDDSLTQHYNDNIFKKIIEVILTIPLIIIINSSFLKKIDELSYLKNIRFKEIEGYEGYDYYDENSEYDFNEEFFELILKLISLYPIAEGNKISSEMGQNDINDNKGDINCLFNNINDNCLFELLSSFCNEFITNYNVYRNCLKINTDEDKKDKAASFRQLLKQLSINRSCNIGNSEEIKLYKQYQQIQPTIPDEFISYLLNSKLSSKEIYFNIKLINEIILKQEHINSYKCLLTNLLGKDLLSFIVNIWMKNRHGELNIIKISFFCISNLLAIKHMNNYDEFTAIVENIIVIGGLDCLFSFLNHSNKEICLLSEGLVNKYFDGRYS